jgi:hypothetical protein
VWEARGCEGRRSCFCSRFSAFCLLWTGLFMVARTSVFGRTKAERQTHGGVRSGRMLAMQGQVSASG